MKKYLLPIIVFLALVVLPSFVLAQGGCDPYSDPNCDIFGTSGSTTGLGGLIVKIHSLLNSIIPLLVALGVVYFVWGVVNYVIADDEEAKKGGRDRIVSGVIGLAVIVSLWGLVGIVVKTFNLSGNVAPSLASITGNQATCSLDGSPKFQDVLCYFTRIINSSIIPLFFAVATAAFVWGSVKFFLIDADEEAKREQGRQFMMWGIIALAVMLSVWGLVGILGSTFNIQRSVLPTASPN